MKNTHALVVLDFGSAEVNFYGITKKESENIEDYLFGEDGLDLKESEVQYIVAPIETLDSNITDVQDAILSLNEEEE